MCKSGRLSPGLVSSFQTQKQPWPGSQECLSGLPSLSPSCPSDEALQQGLASSVAHWYTMMNSSSGLEEVAGRTVTDTQPHTEGRVRSLGWWGAGHPGSEHVSEGGCSAASFMLALTTPAPQTWHPLETRVYRCVQSLHGAWQLHRIRTVV